MSDGRYRRKGCGDVAKVLCIQRVGHAFPFVDIRPVYWDPVSPDVSRTRSKMHASHLLLERPNRPNSDVYSDKDGHGHQQDSGDVAAVGPGEAEDTQEIRFLIQQISLFSATDGQPMYGT
jgi:hypothetical protein